MVEAVMLWNEPNNLSHWDFHLDSDWKIFGQMVIAAARRIRAVNPDLRIVLGGISPIDPHFIRLLGSHGVLDAVDVVAVHGFPLGLESLEARRVAAEDRRNPGGDAEAGLGLRGGRFVFWCG